jgi:hypothetical protein
VATKQVFGYAADSPLRLLLLAYPLFLAGDLLAVHALVPARWILVHVALAVLAVYGFFWLLRGHRSMIRCPHRIDGEWLHVYRGNLGSAAIPVADVVSALPLEAGCAPPAGAARLDVRGAPRVLLSLRAPVACRTMLGTRPADALVISADDPAALCSALRPTDTARSRDASRPNTCPRTGR